MFGAEEGHTCCWTEGEGEQELQQLIWCAELKSPGSNHSELLTHARLHCLLITVNSWLVVTPLHSEVVEHPVVLQAVATVPLPNLHSGSCLVVNQLL